eukprot:3934205-Rhodomonas_salina.1
MLADTSRDLGAAGREGERERERERGRRETRGEGGKEGRRKGGKEERREGGKEGRREGGKEGRREGGSVEWEVKGGMVRIAMVRSLVRSLVQSRDSSLRGSATLVACRGTGSTRAALSAVVMRAASLTIANILVHRLGPGSASVWFKDSGAG